jgi:hypothetical protein
MHNKVFLKWWFACLILKMLKNVIRENKIFTEDDIIKSVSRLELMSNGCNVYILILIPNIFQCPVKWYHLDTTSYFLHSLLGCYIPLCTILIYISVFVQQHCLEHLDVWFTCFKTTKKHITDVLLFALHWK